METEVDADIVGKYSDAELSVLTSVAFHNFKYEVNAGAVANVLKLVDYSTKNKDATRYGTVVWSQKEVEAYAASSPPRAARARSATSWATNVCSGPPR